MSIRERSNSILRLGMGGGGLLRPSEYCHIGGGVLPNRHITFTVSKNA